MLLPSDQTISTVQSTGNFSTRQQSSIPNNCDLNRHIDVLQDTLKDGWTVHVGNEGRLYYCNHITRTAGWLPPVENWGPNVELPYGWEKGVDSKGRSYFVNHLNKTTTYEAPDCDKWDEAPPEPRIAVLQRSPTLGFGFVAGSEKPVIVRFVTEGGPSENKLQPGDHILAVNGEDVKDAPRDHVIQLVRSCETQVTLLVCQPSNNVGSGRKSTLLSAGKRAKLRTRPSRVRFAESVCVNGAPLFPPSAFSLGDLHVPPMANVLKVFLENGQTKSFKYDATTTVQDVVLSLRDKLCLKSIEHFSLVLEHVKSLKRNKLTLLDPEETLARIAARPGAHKLRCLFRVTFVPTSAADLAQKDLNSLDYLYMQCCNDVNQERFAPELQPDIALRLAALHMHQHALANNISPAKLTVKVVEREFGLERFVPSSLMEGMKRKELRRLISHFLKLNSQMTGSSNKMLTQLQAKIHYLDIISSLPSYGAKCFSTNQRDGVERVLLVSPRFGLSQITGVRNSVPQPISAIQEIIRVIVKREDDVTHLVNVCMEGDRCVKFCMEDRDACEFSLVLSGYYKLLIGKDLPVEREREQDTEDHAPSYLSQHTVFPASWSYLLPYHNRTHTMNYLMPPPYHSLQQLVSKDNINSNHCDRNMNMTMVNNNHTCANGRIIKEDEFGIDEHSAVAMDLLESVNSESTNHIIEARNDEVLRRVAEMQKMVESSEQYLNEHGELIHEYEIKSSMRQPWNNISVELDSDTESINSSKVSSNEDAPPPGTLKHSDSLVLLAEAINQDLNGITKGLDAIVDNFKDDQKEGSTVSNSESTTPKQQRKNVHGLSQLLHDLQILGTDCSQSESDSESIYSPNVSPTTKRKQAQNNLNTNQQQRDNLYVLRNQQNESKIIKGMRTSFGLHSPDSSMLEVNLKDNNLREYLRQLQEISKIDENEEIDLAAKKLSELYGFEFHIDTFIETDPDLIDLRTIPPPQTPDELDALSILNAAPQGFDDSTKSLEDDGDLDKFLAKVIVAPPTHKATPAKELTPEEIMQYIIPPPPSLDETTYGKRSVESMSTFFNNINLNESADLALVEKQGLNENANLEECFEESLYSNSVTSLPATKSSLDSNAKEDNLNNKIIRTDHVIEYSTVDRKGPFSCCSKAKNGECLKPCDDKNSCSSTDSSTSGNNNNPLALPPRMALTSTNENAPIRPPKSLEIQSKISMTIKKLHESCDKKLINTTERVCIPSIPPRSDGTLQTAFPNPGVPPKKPPLPPSNTKPVLKNFYVATSNMNNAHHNSELSKKPAGLNVVYPNKFKEIDNQTVGNISSPQRQFKVNGHFRSTNESQKILSEESSAQLSPHCSPQISRRILSLQNHNSDHNASVSDNIKTNKNKLASENVNSESNVNDIQLNKNGHITINGEALLAKTDVAMAGLLVKLDQVAAQCSAAQAAGGGSNIDEEKFQKAKQELTEQTLFLVSASKLLVIALSDATLSSLPENLTSCLTAIRRITELTQDMTRHTSSPLQTRNIVLKVHDVASSFKELAGVQIGPLGAGQLALQAECLANVLATLLRSLRVFSP